MVWDLLLTRMTSRFLLPISAGIGILLGVIAVIISSQTPPTPDIPFAPPSPPYEHFIASVGVVEASSEDISIGTPFCEIVEEVYVDSGDFVKKGDNLFKLNILLLQAKLAEAKAGYEIAVANYERQLALPRPECIPAARAKMESMQANFLHHLARYELVEKIENPKAISRDEYNQRKYNALEAKFQFVEAEEDLNLLLSGAWVKDLEIYRAEKKKALASVKVIEEEIYRSTIKAPLSGVVLQVNIHVGEFAESGELSKPLLVFGAIEPLHILVDIDEEEIWRVIKGAAGVAFVRGNSSISTPIKFVRLLPYLTCKHSLTGTATELSDTRVLQLIYELDRADLPVYPGQSMDVYLESKPNRVVN